MTPSTASLEKAFGAVWSPEQTADIAGWTVSRNGGFTRRLNSACAFGAASTTIRTRDAIVEWLAPGGGGRLGTIDAQSLFVRTGSPIGPCPAAGGAA